MNKQSYLYKSFLALKTEQEVRSFLDDLLTPNEIREFSERLWIANLLTQGKKYQQISEETNASTRTIARVGKCVKSSGRGYGLILNRLHRHESLNRL